MKRFLSSSSVLAVVLFACSPGGTSANNFHSNKGAGAPAAGATASGGNGDAGAEPGDDAGGGDTAQDGGAGGVDAGGSVGAAGMTVANGGAKPTAGSGGSKTTSGGSKAAGSTQAGSAQGGAPLDGLNTTAAVSIIVEPSDKGDAILTAIKNAQKSVHMTMYLLSEDEIISALVKQKSEGHEVKVVLNQTFPDTDTSNAATFTTLQTAGVDVVWAPSTFQYTHEKCVIIDGTTAWIMTMNLTFSSPQDNREYLAIDTDQDDVAEADAIFQADLAGTAASPSGKLVVAPTNARDRILQLIATATKTIDVEAEELSDYKIVSALDAKSNNGVKVRLVLSDGTASAAQTKAVADLDSNGVTCGSLHTPYIHAKAVVVDGKSMYVGSANFTQNSLDSNRELGLLTEDPPSIAKVSTQVAADIAAMTKELRK